MSDSRNFLPPLLLAMLDEGRWPRDEAEARKQNLEPWVPMERVSSATGGDEGTGSSPTYLFLDAPPFYSVAEHVEGDPKDKFWREFADPSGIDFARTVVIGDFGLGSDAPIVIDCTARRLVRASAA